jgi:hypothetical protein
LPRCNVGAFQSHNLGGAAIIYSDDAGCPRANQLARTTIAQWNPPGEWSREFALRSLGSAEQIPIGLVPDQFDSRIG